MPVVNTHVFAVLWGVAMWIHLWNNDIPSLSLTTTALVGWLANGAAFGLVLSRGHGRWLLGAAVVQLLHIALTLPEVAEHWLLMGLVNLVLLTTAALHRTTATATILAACVPTIRFIAIAGYGAAALTKFNWQFLDPVTSCAVELARLEEQVVWMGTSIPGMHYVHIWTALIVEGSVPLLLVFPRTRKLALTIGLPFHFAISFTPAVAVFDFTALLLAFWFLFTPDDMVDRLRVARDTLAARYPEVAPFAPHLLTGAVVSTALFTLVHPWMPTNANLLVRTLAFDTFGLVYSILVLWAVWTSRASTTGSVLPQLPHAVVVAVLLMNGAAPYAGLKSVSSFAMFSNLQTARGVSNHLFLPAVPLSNNLSDLAVIVASTDPYFAEIATNGEALPLHELRRRAQLHAADDAITWTEGGQRFHTDRAGNDDRLKPTWFEATFLVSRSVPHTGRQRCQN